MPARKGRPRRAPRPFDTLAVEIDALHPGRLVLFPDLEDSIEVAEISETSWWIIGKAPETVMCATSRMVARRKEDPDPRVIALTLPAGDRRFDLGSALAEPE